MSAALKKAMVKKDVKSLSPWWRPRNGCDGRLTVKILTMTIQVNLVPKLSSTKFTLIVFIKIFTINLPSQPFLGHHLGFQIFFHHSLFEGRTLICEKSLFKCHIYILYIHIITTMFAVLKVYLQVPKLFKYSIQVHNTIQFVSFVNER